MCHVIQKVFLTKVCNVSITVHNTYTASPVEVSIFKSEFKTCYKEMQSSYVQKINMVSSEKKKDVKKLCKKINCEEMKVKCKVIKKQ